MTALAILMGFAVSAHGLAGGSRAVVGRSGRGFSRPLAAHKSDWVGLLETCPREQRPGWPT